MTEAELRKIVVEIAHRAGWEVFSQAAAKGRRPVKDATGWPDLAMVRPPRFILAELKQEKGVVSARQRRWLGLLEACPGIEVYVFRPSTIEDVRKILA